MKKTKSKEKLVHYTHFIAIIAAFCMVVGVSLYVFLYSSTSTGNRVSQYARGNTCAQDTKTCSNGTVLKRNPTDCSFDICPAPSGLSTRYITPESWPPRLSLPTQEEVLSMVKKSQPIEVGTSTYFMIKSRGIDEKGSYTQYTYLASKEMGQPPQRKPASARIVLYFTDCKELPSPKKEECDEEQESFGRNNTLTLYVRDIIESSRF